MLSLAPGLLQFMHFRTHTLRALAACALVACAWPSAGAQIALTHTDDAAPVPRGMLRTRITTGWTRFDERFSASGRRTLDEELSSDSLGSRELVGLIPIDAGLQALTNDPRVRLSLGRLIARNDARIVTTPIAFEYGLTRRLSIGVVVPLVQTRRAVQVTVNADKKANVGFIPERSRAAAAAANALVHDRMISAADSLTKLLTNCASTPTAPGCAAVNANRADATATRQAAARFAGAVKAALGTDTAAVRIAPRSGGDVAALVEAQRLAIDAKLRTYLGSNAGTTAPVFFATADFSYIDLQGRDGVEGLLQSPVVGLDSLRTTDRLQFGDISLGAQFLVLDRFQRDTLPARGLQMRLSVGAAYRFATSLIDSSHNVLAIPTGDGAGAAVQSALDVIAGRYVGGTVAVRVVKSFARTVPVPQFGDPESLWPIPIYAQASRTAGTIFNLDVTPRFLIGDWFSIDARYGLERVGATTYDRPSAEPCPNCAVTLPGPSVSSTGSRTAHRVGAGIRYSTVDSYLRGKTRLPLEVSFSHLETISGDVGVAKISRDQIQLRLFLRLLGR